jgi:molybdenum cofactor synthesis domain-containing protein
MIPLQEAQEYVLGLCEALPPLAVSLAAALGTVTAQAIDAPEAVPPFDNTAVDGYAVQAADTEGAPVELDVVGTLAAGRASDLIVAPGQALRIMTGAPLPAGVDAIVMVEETVALDGGKRVRINRSVQVGDAVRHIGDDVKPGERVLDPRVRLRPAHLGVLASLGITEVFVHPRPRVGVLSTGDELVADGSPLAPGEIRESNKAMLLGLVAQAGGEPVDLGLVRDDEEALVAALTDACSRCDAVLTSGGVSMGDFDIVKAVLERVGTMRWMQVAIKPAKPFAAGTLHLGGRSVPLFGLPGNPVSSLVSFEVLARPAIRKLAGHRDWHRRTVPAVTDDPIRRHPDGKLHLVRTYGEFGADGRWHVRVTGPQASHQLAATAAANSVALVPDGDGVGAGADVDVLFLWPVE